MLAGSDGRGPGAAPPPLVRLARVLVVLPAAGFAVAGTSAPQYPYAASVAEQDGAVVVGEAIGYTDPAYDGWEWRRRSDDGGGTWHTMGFAERESVRSALGVAVPQLACVPDRRTYCYRVVPGQLRVEETSDGGFTWTTSWQVTEEQRQNLSRHYADLGDPAEHLSSRAVAVVPAPGGHLVVVANGRDGYAVRDSSGNWERIGFGADSPFPYFADPPPLDDPPSRSYAYLWGLVGAMLSLLVASEVLRRQRSDSWRWLDKLGVAPLAVGMAAGFGAEWSRSQAEVLPELVFWVLLAAAAVLTAAGLGLWLALLVMGRALTLRQVLVAVPAALVTGAFVALPLVDGSPLPVGFPVTVIAAVLFWGAGTVAGTTLAWSVDRPAATGPAEPTDSGWGVPDRTPTLRG